MSPGTCLATGSGGGTKANIKLWIPALYQDPVGLTPSLGHPPAVAQGSTVTGITQHTHECVHTYLQMCKRTYTYTRMPAHLHVGACMPFP
jgi:hypothetical protein